MANQTYVWSILDRTPYAADAVTGRAGFIEYVIRFDNKADPKASFEGRVQGDGTEGDLTASITAFLTDRFPAPVVDQVAPTATGTIVVPA